MTALLDILIPTYNRPAALAVTLTSLIAQTFKDFRLVVSDQTPDYDVTATGEVQASLNVLRLKGHSIDLHRHLPAQGMAEQRQFLLDQARAPYALFLDDDLILEDYVVETMLRVIQAEGCGFVGCPVIGLSYLDEERLHEQAIEFWDGPVQPETVRPGTPEWQRYRLHNAANPLHVQKKIGLTPEAPATYRVAWVGGCVMYATARLRAAGGFSFWKELPSIHCGEDVLAQLRVMEMFGGCGVLPSGVYHQELSTTLPDRRVNAPEVIYSQSFQ